MKIASSQINSIVGDLRGNFKKHLDMINLAAKSAVDLIIFPEMSLTGYCRKQARALAVKQSDEEFLQLRDKAILHNITIVVGAPIDIEGDLYIGSYIFNPSGHTDIYTKQYLHAGEEVYFSSSFDYNPTLNIQEEVISFAICADIVHAAHAKAAKSNQCTLYLPTIFYSKDGIDEGYELLSKYAKENSFSILMSNYTGNTWDIEAGGKSAFWDKNGNLIAALDPNKEGLLILKKEKGKWKLN